VRLLAPTEVLMVVVMEWCDLGSLATAIRKQRFRPHGKWTFTSTYVRLHSWIPVQVVVVMRQTVTARHLTLDHSADRR